ncbi:MAG: biotin/lipoyl-binding protein [Bacteroidales bacterium]|nr:biotin/lipoyl-binding protein [Bacteroidales bacterium]
MEKYSFSINGVKYDVDIQSVNSNIAHLEVNGKPYDVEINRETKEVKEEFKEVKQVKVPVVSQPMLKEEATQTKVEVTQAKEEAKVVEKKPASRGAKIEIKSPLPGVILDIFVSKGDAVKKNQKLFSLEAMKMENEIKAEKDGIIESIKVTAGQAVLQEEVVMEMN